MSESLVFVNVEAGEKNQVIDLVMSALNSFRSNRCNAIAINAGYANTLAAIFAQPPYRHADKIANTVLGTFETMAVLKLTVKVGTVNDVFVYNDAQYADASYLAFAIDTTAPEYLTLLNIVLSVCAYSVNNSTDVWCTHPVGKIVMPVIMPVISEFKLEDSDVFADTFVVETPSKWLTLNPVDGSLLSVTDKQTKQVSGAFVSFMEIVDYGE